MGFIYVLLCQEQTYYIGKTERKLERIKEHFTGNGSCWTNLYKPIKVVETIYSNDNMDEDKYTKKYMMLYGIQKVRGGSYSQVNLPEYKIKCLQDEFSSVNDSCFKCNKSGHFVNECKEKRAVKWCERCGRTSHSLEKCFAKLNVDGNTIEKNYKEQIEDEEKIRKYNEQLVKDMINNVKSFYEKTVKWWST